jgi:flagellar basal-body rod protein FlgB
VSAIFEDDMQSILDRYLGIHPQALTLESQRMDVLAANLANVDTPNYKARDLDFKAALAAAAGPASAPTTGAALTLTTTAPDDLTAAGTLAAADAARNGSTGVSESGASSAASFGAAAALKYRVPLAPALDGNTVDEQLEQSAFAENGVRYQASLTLLNVKLHDLLSAIASS